MWEQYSRRWKERRNHAACSKNKWNMVVLRSEDVLPTVHQIHHTLIKKYHFILWRHASPSGLYLSGEVITAILASCMTVWYASSISPDTNFSLRSLHSTLKCGCASVVTKDSGSHIGSLVTDFGNLNPLPHGYYLEWRRCQPEDENWV